MTSSAMTKRRIVRIILEHLDRRDAGCHTAASRPSWLPGGRVVGEIGDWAAGGFEGYRGRLFGVAYRMLGSRADAEDIVQDAYVRWHQTNRESVRNAEAWLVATTTRLAID